MTNTKRQLDAEGTVTNLGYDSYATSWRYLGIYIDCGNRRNLKQYSNMAQYYRENYYSNGGASNRYGSGSSCSRKLLWAAYYDPNYSGSEIGEYMYYANNQWDASTCTGNRCSTSSNTSRDCRPAVS